MDALPPQPPAIEQSIKQKIADCGLHDAGISVSYQRDLQGYEILIAPVAGATSNQFACLETARADDFVTFSDKDMQKQYLDFLAARYRPQLLAQAKENLARQGLLKGLPRRAAFESDNLFVEAIEVHCGLSKGSAITRVGSKYAFQVPPSENLTLETMDKKYGCLLDAIQVVNSEGGLEIGLGFVGNEASRPGK